MKPVARARVLEGRRAWGDYAACAAQSIGVAFPLAYLARGRVVGLFEGERLVGGFAVVQQGPFRSVEQLPASARTRVACRLDACPQGVVEVNGLFLSPQVACPEAVVAFWSALAAELCRSSASGLLYSYPVSSRALRRLYGVLQPELLYAGPVRRLEGMATPEVERTELAEVATAVRTLMAPDWLRRRVGLRRAGR